MAEATQKMEPDPRLDLRAVAYEAFKRDLPSLLQADFGKVVAYRGEERLYMEETIDSLYESIKAANLDFNDLLIRRIEPQPTEIRLNWNW